MSTITPPAVAAPTTATVEVSKSTMIILSAIGLLIALVILAIFFRVVGALMRMKKATASMGNLDMTQLKTMMGGDEKDAQAIKDGDDNLWINLTLIGIVLAYGIGSILGAFGSVSQLYRAIAM